MNNLKPFEQGLTNVVESFESNPHKAPKIESFSVSERGTILMIRINGVSYGYFITE